MENNTANPIKEYYIAYFDILGYKAFFEENLEKANEFLNIVNSAISNTLATIDNANVSPLAAQFANLHIQSKIFLIMSFCVLRLETTLLRKNPA